MLVELEGPVAGGRSVDAGAGRLVQARRDVYHVILARRVSTPPIARAATLC